MQNPKYMLLTTTDPSYNKCVAGLNIDLHGFYIVNYLVQLSVLENPHVYSLYGR